MIHPDPWEQMAEDLTSKMLYMADGDAVILSVGDRFVQFKQGPDRMDAEAVSNEWLPPDQRLSSEDEEQLQAMGWQQPEPAAGFDNWRCSEEWPLRSGDARRMAARLITTLRDVLGIEDPRTVERKALNVYGRKHSRA